MIKVLILVAIMLIAVSSVAITNAQTVTEEDMLQNKAIREYLTTNTEAGKYYRESFYDLPTETQDKILTNANITRDELIKPTNGLSSYFVANDQLSDTDSGNAAQIVLLSQKLKKPAYEGSSFRDIVGQVKNIGNATATSIQIGVTIYDKNGDVVGTDTGYTEADSLRSGQKSAFTIMTNADDFKGMGHYELSLEWSGDAYDSETEYVENAQIYKDNSTITKQS